MAMMAAGFEVGDRASARAAQAAASPAIWSVFPATIERRLKIFRCGNEFEEFISAADCPARNCSELVSHVTALSPTGGLRVWSDAVPQLTAWLKPRPFKTKSKSSFSAACKALEN